MPELNVNPAVREIEREGYRVRLDLSHQVLHLSVPEDFVWGPEDGTRAQDRLRGFFTQLLKENYLMEGPGMPMRLSIR